MIDTLSVVIITKNAADTIAKTLKSVKCVTEVVIYDNGSADGTLDIVREYPNVRLFTGEFLGFGPTKNHAVSLAGNNWVFILDADECFTEALISELEDWRPGDPREVFKVKRDNLFMGKLVRWGGWGNDKLIRLFNRTEHRFTDCPVHEKVAVNSSSKVVLLRSSILHYAVCEIRQILEKINLYSEIRKETSKKRLSPPLIVLRSLYALFKSYVLQLGFLEGWRGLVIAVSNANGVFYKYFKIHSRLRG